MFPNVGEIVVNGAGEHFQVMPSPPESDGVTVKRLSTGRQQTLSEEEYRAWFLFAEQKLEPESPSSPVEQPGDDSLME